MYLPQPILWISLALAVLVASCETVTVDGPTFHVIDTDFSKGRLTHEQHIGLDDLEKFHGHLCDGLLIGALGMQQALAQLYPEGPVDRTNLRLVSASSPCITDVAVYITGGRYQFNTYYTDNSIGHVFIVQRIDNGKTVSVSLKPGVKPEAIDSLGALAVQQQLSPCEIDSLRKLEDTFTANLLAGDPSRLFETNNMQHFEWNPKLRNGFTKTDVINKDLPVCDN